MTDIAKLKEAVEKARDTFKAFQDDNSHNAMQERLDSAFSDVGAYHAEILALLSENERLREALTPSAETKAAYIGEFSFNVEGYDFENEVDTTHKVQVPWTVIKEIMAAISARAALKSSGLAIVPVEPTQMQRLGLEFEKAIFDDVEGLYEP